MAQKEAICCKYVPILAMDESFHFNLEVGLGVERSGATSKVDT